MIPGYGHTTDIMRLFYYTGRMLSIQMDWQKCTKKFEFFLNKKSGPADAGPDGDAYLREASRAAIFLMGSMMEPTLISWLMAATK